jgi:hypothetical protein
MTRCIFLAALILLTSVNAFGQQPIVRISVTPEAVTVGESAEITVTVLVPTWFTKPPIYPSFELVNAITRLPADSSYSFRERVGNESWSGIARTYEIYPLLGATYKLSGQSLKLTYANPGADPVTTSVDIDELVFRGVVPAGAEALVPYIAGRSLKIRLNVEGDLENLAAGDAIVLNYVAELEGLPAIFLPPLSPELVFDGVSVYADEPDVEEGTPARRREKSTLVFDSGGEFSVPDIDVTYWNTESRAIETVLVPGLSISVKGPVAAIADAGTITQSDWRPIAAILGAAFVVALILAKYAPVIMQRYRESVERRRESERYAFDEMQSAMRSGEAKTSYHALLHWLERLEPGLGPRQFAQRYGDEPLVAAVDTVSASIYSDGANARDSRQLAARLRKARKRYISRTATIEQRVLPPLNP